MQFDHKRAAAIHQQIADCHKRGARTELAGLHSALADLHKGAAEMTSPEQDQSIISGGSGKALAGFFADQKANQAYLHVRPSFPDAPDELADYSDISPEGF